MIVSLNLPEDVVAFIDQQATNKNLSRSAWMTALLRNMQVVDSEAGRQELARTLAAVMVEGALQSGQSMEQVQKAFPQFQQLLAAAEEPDAPQLPPASSPATPAPPSPAPADSNAAPVTRRRPYQRASAATTHRQKP